MKICNQCTKENTDENKFCAFCGNTLEEPCEQPTAPQPRIENTFPMTKDTLRLLYKHFKILGIIMCALGGILALLYILSAVIWEDDLSVVCCFPLGVGIAFLYIYRMFVVKNKIVSDDTRLLYRFYEKEFHGLTFKGEEKREESHFTYRQIQKAKKLGNFYYLYVGAVALVVKADTFTVGTKEEFVALLKEKCDPKTVKIKK